MQLLKAGGGAEDADSHVGQAVRLQRDESELGAVGEAAGLERGDLVLADPQLLQLDESLQARRREAAQLVAAEFEHAQLGEVADVFDRLDLVLDEEQLLERAAERLEPADVSDLVVRQVQHAQLGEAQVGDTGVARKPARVLEKRVARGGEVGGDVLDLVVEQVELLQLAAQLLRERDHVVNEVLAHLELDALVQLVEGDLGEVEEADVLDADVLVAGIDVKHFLRRSCRCTGTSLRLALVCVCDDSRLPIICRGT